MTQDENTPPKRPVEPLTGLVILAGSFGAAGLVTALAARLFPWSEQTLAQLPLAGGSDGLWLLVAAAVFFPFCLGWSLLRLAPGVEHERLRLAFGGGIYIVQCTAELVTNDTLHLWPQLFTTILAVLVFGAVQSRFFPQPAPDEAP